VDCNSQGWLYTDYSSQCSAAAGVLNRFDGIDKVDCEQMQSD